MTFRSLKLIGLISVSGLALSACSVASGYSKAEQDIVTSMDTSKYQPSPRHVRDNIETQDNFAQAAFWSREYQLNPADLEASIKLASSVRKMGNASKAVEITQTTRALHPDDPYLAAEYAAALIATERGEEAIGALDNALRAAPGYARLWSLKGAALDQMENYDLARRHYARALQITPKDPNIMTNMGLSYALAGDPYQAEAWLRQAASMPGAGANTRQNLDLIMQLQGKQTPQPQTAQRAKPDVRDFEYVPPSRNAAQQNYNGLRQAPSAQRTSRQQMPAQRQAQPTYNASPQNQGYRARAPQQQGQTYQRQQQQQAYQPQQTYKQSTVQSAARQSQYAPAPTQVQPRGYQSPGHRSNLTVTGNQAGAPTSASEMARSIAQHSQSQNRRVVTPVTAAPKTAQQTSILDQIAGNVGPRPTGQPSAAKPSYRQAYSEPVEDYPAPETLPRRYNPYYAQQHQQQGYRGSGNPQGQPTQQPYTQPSPAQPTARGAARSRR